ncbi:hypothetical protein [Pyrofollis japonicus]|nr:hypothetical protein [Pyrofollis japonicus]
MVGNKPNPPRGPRGDVEAPYKPVKQLIGEQNHTVLFEEDAAPRR